MVCTLDEFRRRDESINLWTDLRHIWALMVQNADRVGRLSDQGTYSLRSCLAQH